MKISEVIKALEDIKEEGGDIECYIRFKAKYISCFEKVQKVQDAIAVDVSKDETPEDGQLVAIFDYKEDKRMRK